VRAIVKLQHVGMPVCVCVCVPVTELDSSNILRWLVVHNIRRHPHYSPPGRHFVVTAQEVYLREHAFYHMLYDFTRYLFFLALVLVLVNMRNDYDIFLRNDSVYRQVFSDPHFKHVRHARHTTPHLLHSLQLLFNWASLSHLRQLTTIRYDMMIFTCAQKQHIAS